jgi:hypothetical protein
VPTRLDSPEAVAQRPLPASGTTIFGRGGVTATPVSVIDGGSLAVSDGRVASSSGELESPDKLRDIALESTEASGVSRGGVLPPSMTRAPIATTVTVTAAPAAA